jgi:hypothetical protein
MKLLIQPLNSQICIRSAYIFVMTSKKDTGMDNSEAAEKSRGNGKAAVEVPSDTNTTTPIPETQDIPPPIPEKKNQTEESSREETY